jgi:hypothetical protein
MNAQRRATVVDIYKTDLDRHLFAPAPRRNGRATRQPYLDGVGDRLRDWLASGWTRWKGLAEAMYF